MHHAEKIKAAVLDFTMGEADCWNYFYYNYSIFIFCITAPLEDGEIIDNGNAGGDQEPEEKEEEEEAQEEEDDEEGKLTIWTNWSTIKQCFIFSKKTLYMPYYKFYCYFKKKK